jgi:hypothetical protein
MAYEAMLAGLEMTPFRGGFKEKDLKPKTGEDSMGHFYKSLEYLCCCCFQWEDHSESHSLLLTSEKPPPRRRFSRSAVFLFSRAHPISKCLYEGIAIANVPGRYMTTKSCIHLCACIMTCPRLLSLAFPNHGSIHLRGETTGRRS